VNGLLCFLLKLTFLFFMFVIIIACWLVFVVLDELWLVVGPIIRKVLKCITCGFFGGKRLIYYSTNYYYSVLLCTH
jgi:hypothetical protein